MKIKQLHHGPFSLRNITFAEFSGVSIDSRHIDAGNIFCALKGEHSDGHRFVEKALASGALAAMVTTEYAAHNGSDQALIIVDDTYQGLIDMATRYAEQLTIPILAITGSVGKTSTRGLISHILREKMTVAETPKNFNNHIGLPISVLRIHERDEIAVLEMGTSGMGEIRELCKIVVPSYGIITSIAHAHIGGLGSIENVQKAKYELFDSVKDDGILFINNDDPRVAAYPKDSRKRVTYGLENHADIKLEILDIDALGCYTLGYDQSSIHLNTIGKGAAINAVAAFAFTKTIGLDERETIAAIESFEPIKGRSKLEKWNGIILIDDSYNANPYSVKNAIHALKNMKNNGKKIMVFGDMLEMGVEAIASHEEIGRIAVESGISHLFCIGDDSLNTVRTAKESSIRFAEHYYSKKELAADLMTVAKPGDIILFKASRGIAIEEVISLIKDM
jgi:UDP-N-acetylmuramoyl-tripeptide--D-alanyl-D-alanine ligase